MDVTAGEIARPRRVAPAQIVRLIIEIVLGLVVLALCAAAFVGLDASSYWIDELWTLFVVDHALGVGEVVRRALTDTHPPVYYVIIHGWVRLFGDSEAVTRSFSALCAVGASVLFVTANGDAFSRPARLFGAAAGASSMYWFEQSQNMRSYALSMLILTALLSCAAAARRRSLAGGSVSWSLCAGIAALGLVGAFVHYYLFLAIGLLYLALLVGVKDLRLRATVLVCGCVILAAVLAYMHLADRHLIFTKLWFNNSQATLIHAFRNAMRFALGRWAKRALFVLIVGIVAGFWLKRRGQAAGRPGAAPLGRWIAGTSVFVAVGLVVLGLAISLLIKPSLSDRNLMMASPCLWFVAAWVYDEAVGALPSRTGLAFAGLATVLMAMEVVGLQGRLLNRNQDWRGSAQYVSQGACRGRDIVVILPWRFGPDTPFFRRLAEQTFFGWYHRGGGRLLVASEGELAASRDPQLVNLLAARASGADPCPVLAWGVHDMFDETADALARVLAQRPEVHGPVFVRHFRSYGRHRDRWVPDGPGAYVFERSSAAERSGGG
jgi:4-amino-4-deoxy-L-arabinose transferase-like glycosyltransferase